MIERVIINGREFDADKYISSLCTRTISITRVRYKKVCAECGQEIGLRAGDKNKPHFYHKKEAGFCAWKTEKHSSKSSIYIGEQKDHANNKRLIAAILKSLGFTVKVEKTLADEKGYKHGYRRPDIYVTELKLAIEIQKSWIGPDTLEERTAFFRSNHHSVLWVFIPCDSKSQPMRDVQYGLVGTHDQVFHFEDSHQRSAETDGILSFRCEYICITGESISREIQFDELKLQDGPAYALNHDGRYDVLHGLEIIKRSNEKPEGIRNFVNDIQAKIKKGIKLTDKQNKSITNTLRFNGFDHINLIGN